MLRTLIDLRPNKGVPTQVLGFLTPMEFIQMTSPKKVDQLKVEKTGGAA
jgi:hypothetical protein